MKEAEIRDEFLSEEDLDLKNLSEEELLAYWNFWMEQAQVTNEEDRNLYSHGVFISYPPVSILILVFSLGFWQTLAGS
jgi:hypothetical protein